MIAEQAGCHPQDPHAHVTAGAFPRASLLEQAVRVACSTLRRPAAAAAEVVDTGELEAVPAELEVGERELR